MPRSLPRWLPPTECLTAECMSSVGTTEGLSVGVNLLGVLVVFAVVGYHLVAVAHKEHAS